MSVAPAGLVKNGLICRIFLCWKRNFGNQLNLDVYDDEFIKAGLDVTKLSGTTFTYHCVKGTYLMPAIICKYIPFALSTHVETVVRIYRG